MSEQRVPFLVYAATARRTNGDRRGILGIDEVRLLCDLRHQGDNGKPKWDEICHGNHCQVCSH
jgi:hypothetical protein